MLLFNSRDTAYKKPFGAVKTGEKVEINFPISRDTAASGVFLILRGKTERRIELSLIGERDGYNIYNTVFSLDSYGIYRYRFEIATEKGFIFVGRMEDGSAVNGDWLPEWQLTVYKDNYKTPDWLKGGIIYHIFADRFARIEDGKKPRFGYLKSWNQDVNIADADGVYRADDYFGGNIKGILSKLDYLKSLSVSAVYLSPIFESSSNHRYDTADYTKIDPLFGTEQEFEHLVEECGKRGIAVILDGVFNHTGADSVYFNKFGHYDSKGAYQSKDSKYYGWYTFNRFPDKYQSWWGITVVPSIRKDCCGFQEMIAGKDGILEKWTATGVKGWRLDVADELSSDFIKKIRGKVKEYGDVALIGEVWEDASTKISYSEEREYLFGEQLDGVMNYPYRTAILNYIRDKNPEKFVNAVLDIAENYPQCALNCCMTLIGTHDTVRAINELSAVVQPDTKAKRLAYRLEPDIYREAKMRLKLAAVLQYVLPGVPTVYYGDEIGMEGFEDPINRRPMPEKGDIELLDYYRKLGRIRAENRRDLVKGIKIEALDGTALIIERGNLSAVVNPGKNDFTLPYSVFDLLTEKETALVKGGSAVIFNNKN